MNQVETRHGQSRWSYDDFPYLMRKKKDGDVVPRLEKAKLSRAKRLLLHSPGIRLDKLKSISFSTIDFVGYSFDGIFCSITFSGLKSCNKTKE